MLPRLEPLESRFLPASWSTIASFASVGREWLAAVSGSDGRIYAIGGQSLSGTTVTQTGEVDAYTISTNKWATASPLPDAATELAAAEGGDGRIDALGGLDVGGNVLGTVYAYSPTTNKWTLLAPLPTPRFDMAAAEGKDGRVYAIGGSTSKTTLGSSVIEIYDPTTNTWSEGPPMPTARYGAAATVGSNGDIYVVGGANASSTALATVEAYNPTANRWTTLNPMPTAVYYLGAALGSDGKIYAVGGTGTGTDHQQITQIYVPTSNTWSAGPVLITGRSAMGVAPGTNGSIYAIGGIGVIGTATAAPLTTAETLNVSGTPTPPTPPPPSGGVAGTGPNARYVEQLYRDLLGRAADSGGLTGFTQALDDGTNSNSVVALAILTSTENRTDAVEQLYAAVLGRSADPSGLQSSLAFLEQGHTSLELEAVLLGSAEYFQNHAQGSNTGFIQAVYQLVLGRQPDPTGEQVFLQDLNNGETTRSVAQQILASSEAESRQVQSLYESLLHRSADPAGLSLGMAILQNGRGLEGVTFIIVTSAEYVNDANANTPVVFVSAVYHDLLGRAPDPQGLSAFSGALSSGAITRTQAALIIQDSTEFFTAEVNTLYQEVLHRAPDAGGLAGSVALLASGVTVTDLEAILLGSSEFYTNIGGGTNAGFASALYQVALGRAIDPTGAQGVSQALAQGISRGAVALNVLHSTEGETDEITALYKQFLHRVPDSGGLSASLTLLNAGVSVEQLQAILIGSDEYLSLL